MIGYSLPRFEDERLLRGEGRFIADVALPGMAHAVFVRAPVAHAALGAIDTATARAMPGVLGVFTGADLVAGGMKPLPCIRPITSVDGRPFFAPVRHAIALEVVRHVGEAVAMIVAESEACALDAAEAVVVSYDERPVIADPRRSDEYAFLWEKGTREPVDGAFSNAAHVASVEVVNNRIVISPLETRGAVAAHDADTGLFTLYAPTQGVHLVRRLIATTLDIAPEGLRLITNDVGGSFGLKLVNAPEQTALLFAARALDRPVRWIATRMESHLSDVAGRDHMSRGEIALDADYRILALRVETIGNLGAYASALSPTTHTSGFAATLCGPYRIPALHLVVRGVYTNTAPTDAFRGSGKPESVYLLERLFDAAARQVGIDRVELRRRNLIPTSAMPYEAANGYIYESADFDAVLDRALEEADWSGFAKRRSRSEAAGLTRGIGLGLYIHTTGVTSEEISTARLDAEGQVTIETGLQSSGQGHETTFAQLVAERLEIAPEEVRIVQGDTDRLGPTGGPTAGSSSLQVGGVNILRAVDAMLDAARDRAAETLEANAADLVYGKGRFTVAGTDRSVSLSALAEGDVPSCAGEAKLSGEILTIPNGAYVCEVEIDPDTGHVAIARFTGVDDVGRRLNPQIVEGQMHGALAQGIGQALHERVVYDDDTGQMLTGSLMDYGLPRADDLPMFSLFAADTPTARNPLGMKGAGEVGCIGAPAAVINAIADALGHDRIDMPATPERVWRALNPREELA